MEVEPEPLPVVAVAPAPSRDPGVTIAPFTPAEARYTEPEIDVDLEQAMAAMEPEAHHQMQEPFIPPVAETPPVRMPKIEDFPPVAQRQMDPRYSAPVEEDRGPLSLLRRLAHVGLGRREEEPASARAAVQPAPQRPAQAKPSMQQPRVQAPPPPSSDYAKRPAAPRAPQQEQNYRPRQGELDPHGRPVPRDQRHADDELEIPAFLRRQAN